MKAPLASCNVRGAVPFHSGKHHCQRRHLLVGQANQPSTPTAAAAAPAATDVTRRHHLQLLAVAAAASLVQQPLPAAALGFKKELKRKKIPIEEYADLPGSGLKYYELELGKGAEVLAGSRVTVHFDSMYKGIDAVSSRSARLLGGNRVLAEPFEFVAGSRVSGMAVRKISDADNGLFAGTGGPKPPPALSSAVLGMRVGGKRSLIVPPELGYGDKGEQEIPPGATFELRVEVLAVSA